MFAVQTDATQYVIGVEVATQLQFVARHQGDTSWSFVDSTQFWSANEQSLFMINPKKYYIDDMGILRRDHDLDT